MRIPIERFQILERNVLRERGFWKNLLGKAKTEYHFDIRIHVPEWDRIKLSGLKPYKDQIQLPNGVRLLIWYSYISEGVIHAKTINWIGEDLVMYHPAEMFLVYEHRHGHQWVD